MDTSKNIMRSALSCKLEILMYQYKHNYKDIEVLRENGRILL